jgi:hypothetical protein
MAVLAVGSPIRPERFRQEAPATIIAEQLPKGELASQKIAMSNANIDQGMRNKEKTASPCGRNDVTQYLNPTGQTASDSREASGQ